MKIDLESLSGASATSASSLPQPDAPPSRRHEPLLAAEQIQGNIFPGFEQDHVTLLFLRITDPGCFSRWLAGLVPFVATMKEVLVFRRLSQALHRRRGATQALPAATWLNVAFSFAGLRALSEVHPTLELGFQDPAFSQGLLQRSRKGCLGDPVGTGLEGDPIRWVVGGVDREADLVVLVSSDDPSALAKEVARLERTIYALTDERGIPLRSGLAVLYKQEGAALPGALRGHEHFGFRDSLSQPGIRGCLWDGSFLTPSENPSDPHQGKPGQDLVWPGEFVFGYPGQDGSQPFTEPGQDPLSSPTRAAPGWARNGSFLVIRRLRQYVGMFHQFLHETARQFNVTPELIGAKLVGRWPSGAPLLTHPDADDPRVGQDENRLNHFEYGRGAKALRSSSAVTGGEEPAIDPDGTKCPFVGHIRKVFPRNDTSRDLRHLDRSMAHTHRLLRRGIPYGEVSSSTFRAPVEDTVDRGLLFMAYQSSIEEQFEFVTKKFANDHNFKQHGLGYDPLIGQNDSLPNRFRAFKVHLNGELRNLTTYKEWVVPTGGGYFFAPSVDALRMLAGQTPPPPPHGAGTA